MGRNECNHYDQHTTDDCLCNKCQLERQNAVATEDTTDDREADCETQRHPNTTPISRDQDSTPFQESTHRTDTHTPVATDGGTDTRSKYVIPTGSGYRGTYTVSPDRKVSVGTAAFEGLDWTANQRVHACEHEDGVALVQGPTENAIASYQLSPRYDRGRICVGQDVVDELAVDPGDDVRVYALEDDSLLLVDAENDPRVATDGGHATDPRTPPASVTEITDTHTTLELVFEYTTIDDRQRRVTIVPDTGGEAWRIEHERRNGEWRETGREPISGVDVRFRGLFSHPSEQPDDADSDHTEHHTNIHR